MKKLIGKILRTFVRITVTLVFVALAAGTIVIGQETLANRAAARPAPDPAPATPVVTERLTLQDSYRISRKFSGQIEARQQTDLAFEQAGTIAAVLVREGDRVQAGQPIARLDTRLLEAEKTRLNAQRAAIEAQVELARRTNARQAELQERGFASAQRVDDTSLALSRLEAEIAGVDASIVAVEVNLSKAELRAPFNGTIARRDLDVGTVASPGIAVASVLEGDAPRFRAGLDPALADGLEIGTPVTIQLRDGTLAATLAQLTPDLDPITRARVAFFDIDGPAPPARTTGEVLLTQEAQGLGAWVPLSALRQGPRGTWTVMTITDGKATVEAAEIHHLESDRAYIRGTFADGAAYIPGGTHRLVPGQTVTENEALAWAR